MKIYALICQKLILTQFWPKVVSWRFEITTDEMCKDSHNTPLTMKYYHLITLMPKEPPKTSLTRAHPHSCWVQEWARVSKNNAN